MHDHGAPAGKGGPYTWCRWFGAQEFEAWHLVLQKMITCLASFSKLLCGRIRDVLHQAKCSSGQFAGHQGCMMLHMLAEMSLLTTQG